MPIGAFCLIACAAMSKANFANIQDLAMSTLIEQVLVFRKPGYIEGFCEKLLGEGIASPSDLLRCSKDALEAKLQTHASFNYIEMADTLSLRSAIDPDTQASARPGGGRRSRSAGRGRGGKGHPRNNRGNDRRSSGFSNDSWPHRRNYKWNRSPILPKQAKPRTPAQGKTKSKAKNAFKNVKSKFARSKVDGPLVEKKVRVVDEAAGNGLFGAEGQVSSYISESLEQVEFQRGKQ